eukprot:TRINITY_DN1934_c0_g1_i1.p1 TRINITY_DN1934_c0_g1~~TRINITY_DN1934_c0_g1_i1.p1  ORF type:complete len:478 (-),score=34.25 TRINITY_DN1934_c0_g1_i1:237-1670(-)
MCTKAGFTWVGDNNADATGPSKGGNCIASPQVCPDKKSICFNQQSYSGYGATCTAAGNCACAKSGYTWVAISKSEPFGDCVASESVCPDRRTYCQVVVDTALGTNASTSCNLSGKCTCAQPDRTWIFIYETKGTELVGQCMAPAQVCPGKKRACYNILSKDGEGATCDASGKCGCAQSGHTWFFASFYGSQAQGQCVASHQVCPDKKTFCSNREGEPTGQKPGRGAGGVCNADGTCRCTAGYVWFPDYRDGSEIKGTCVASHQVCPDQKTYCSDNSNDGGKRTACDANGNCTCVQAGYAWFADAGGRIGPSKFGYCAAPDQVCPSKQSYCFVYASVDGNIYGTESGKGATCGPSGECTCTQAGHTWVLDSHDGHVRYGQCLASARVCKDKSICTGKGAICRSNGKCGCARAHHTNITGYCAARSQVCPDHTACYNTLSSNDGKGVTCSASGVCTCTKAGRTWMYDQQYGQVKHGQCI